MDYFKIVILKNENERDIEYWVRACDKNREKIFYAIVDITRYDWMEKILSEKPDILLTKPSGKTAPMKQLYDERLMILVNELGYDCYPSLDEILVYENKRYFSYWLAAHNVPHPATRVFYHKDEAIEFTQNTNFPIVAKLNIGASGNGVVILKKKAQAVDYIKDIFSKGKTARTGPKLSKGRICQRAWRKITHPSELSERLKTYKTIASDIQSGFCIFQEYIPHFFEWRVVRIGDSFFAHKKLKKGEKASGSLLKEYCDPPLELLDFVKVVTDKFSFYSQAVDLFEISDGKYIINEMQCIFGQSDLFQMLVDGKPGRYLKTWEDWVFEEGNFASNQCYDLRLQHVLKRIENAAG